MLKPDTGKKPAVTVKMIDIRLAQVIEVCLERLCRFPLLKLTRALCASARTVVRVPRTTVQSAVRLIRRSP